MDGGTMAIKIPLTPAEDLMPDTSGNKFYTRPTNQDFMMALAVMKDQGRLKADAPPALVLQQQSPTKQAFTPDGSS
jgi:hypothetical protein